MRRCWLLQADRAYVSAYVEYTHYVERLQIDAQGHMAHHEEPFQKQHETEKHNPAAYRLEHHW